jgi:alcohol dehydrogenase class IV
VECAVEITASKLCLLKIIKVVDTSVTMSLQCLISGLLLTAASVGEGKEGMDEAKVRLECQIGISYAMLFLHRKVYCDASHVIVHMLGPIGHVNHRQTSAIFLPAICGFNAKHGDVEVLGRKQKTGVILWTVNEAREWFLERELVEGKTNRDVTELGDLIRVTVGGLGLKGGLGEVGMVREKFDRLVEASKRDPFMGSNPVPIEEGADFEDFGALCLSL